MAVAVLTPAGEPLPVGLHRVRCTLGPRLSADEVNAQIGEGSAASLMASH